MKVISVKKKNKKTTNCIVTLVEQQSDGNYNDSIIETELSMDIVVKERLAKDAIISSQQWIDILATQRIIDVKQTAYRYAASMNKTQRQVVQRLQLQGFVANEIDIAISFLKEFNLLDDALFSQKYIKDTLLTKNIGRTGLLYKLISKGVDKRVAELAIQQFYPAEETYTMLCDIVRKKMCVLNRQNKSPDKIRASIFNHVLTKGFTFEDAKKAIELIAKSDSL